jgi:hypothetical protein
MLADSKLDSITEVISTALGDGYMVPYYFAESCLAESYFTESYFAESCLAESYLAESCFAESYFAADPPFAGSAISSLPLA